MTVDERGEGAQILWLHLLEVGGVGQHLLDKQGIDILSRDFLAGVTTFLRHPLLTVQVYHKISGTSSGRGLFSSLGFQNLSKLANKPSMGVALTQFAVLMHTACSCQNLAPKRRGLTLTQTRREKKGYYQTEEDEQFTAV